MSKNIKHHVVFALSGCLLFLCHPKRGAAFEGGMTQDLVVSKIFKDLLSDETALKDQALSSILQFKEQVTYPPEVSDEIYEIAEKAISSHARAAALDVIRLQFPPQQVDVRRLLKLATTSGEYVRRHALECLDRENLSYPKGTPEKLLNILKDNGNVNQCDYWSALFSVRAIKHMGPLGKKARPVLITRCLSDLPPAGMNRDIIEALFAMDPSDPVVSALAMREFKSEFAESRLMGAELLGRVGLRSLGVRTGLWDLMNHDESETVRNAAKESYRKLFGDASP